MRCTLLTRQSALVLKVHVYVVRVAKHLKEEWFETILLLNALPPKQHTLVCSVAVAIVA